MGTIVRVCRDCRQEFTITTKPSDRAKLWCDPCRARWFRQKQQWSRLESEQVEEDLEANRRLLPSRTRSTKTTAQGQT